MNILLKIQNYVINIKDLNYTLPANIIEI